MSLLNISSIEDFTNRPSERSMRGSRLLMMWVCMRTRTSRCASRAGEALWESGPSAGGPGRGLRGRGGGGLRGGGGELLGEREDVLGDLTLAMADDERHTPVDREDQRAAVRDDGVRDLPTEARLDVGRLDSTRAVVPVRDELELFLAIADLLGDLHEHADVLEARDFGGHERGEDVPDVENGDDLLLEGRPGV